MCLRKTMLAAASLLALCSCTTTPPPACPAFPNPPGSLMVDPLPLERLATNTPLKLSGVLTTVDTNYGVCHANAQQLIDLQQWVTNQRDLKS